MRMTENLVESISKRTGISIKELNRLNKDEWFHGTTIEDAKNIMLNGVDALYNVGSGHDYGPGFYLAPTLETAESYISKLPLVLEDGTIKEARTEWAILKFEFNPFDLLFRTDSKYTFYNFPKYNEEFGKFVLKNWTENVNNENPHGYDIIWGVMSDSVPDKIASDYETGRISYSEAVKMFMKSTSMKQLYIGNNSICESLTPIYEKEVK